jgi:pantothenate kinase
MPSTPEALADAAARQLCTLPGPRSLVAIAGPPGAGKSTVSDRILARLADEGRTAAVVPMDGFHLDNALLAARGLLHRKGAPETFDADGFRHLVARIAAGEPEVIYPVFDRSRDIAIAGAGVLKADVEFVLFEGNYLLLREAPWSGLAQYWTRTIWIDAPLPTLEERLMERWHAEGLGEDEARTRVQGNDLPNARRVIEGSLPGDIVLRVPAPS